MQKRTFAPIAALHKYSIRPAFLPGRSADPNGASF